ncbi:hypothetical protein L6452_33326 [Arctium lappa]|uniref:Uncharacterized protein n=1 Tax=Arctium lappa TaxID=4217 RepID=A0ACB8YF08_ARCLA|nr:hypothetical protein L6452_33326 [Arctium lappa]
MNEMHDRPEKVGMGTVIRDARDDVSEYGDITDRIHSILHHHAFFSIKAIGRQANGVAHALAQLARLNSCPVSFSSLPPSISCLLNDVCRLGAH